MTVKITQPEMQTRNAQHYVAIRSQVTMQELPTIIPSHIDEVAAWLGQRRVEPDGPPLIRYHVCPTSAEPNAMLDIAIGWPVASAVPGSGQFIAGELPSGQYASLVYTGVENGISGNAALIEWAQAQEMQWDSWDEVQGEAFAGRVEHLLDGPEDDPDPANWDTEVAIKLADK
jgi:effector-binding domain-containing protein